MIGNLLIIMGVILLVAFVSMQIGNYLYRRDHAARGK
jgi:hypothetical protein